jgi:hypothetical protein
MCSFGSQTRVTFKKHIVHAQASRREGTSGGCQIKQCPYYDAVKAAVNSLVHTSMLSLETDTLTNIL